MQLLFLLQLFLKLENLHLHTHNIVILISNHFFKGRRIDVWFFRVIGINSFVEVPDFDLSFHSPIFFFYIPDPGLKRAVFFFDLIDNALEIIVFIPNDILGSHIAVEVDIRVEDIVIGVDLLFEQFFILDSPV
jgi:hypothetical protein